MRKEAKWGGCVGVRRKVRVKLGLEGGLPVSPVQLWGNKRKREKKRKHFVRGSDLGV